MRLLCLQCSAWVEVADDHRGGIVCEPCRARAAAKSSPKKKRPSFWVSDEELAIPPPEHEVWCPTDQSSSLMDLQMIVQESGAASAKAPARRIDDDLVRLDAPVFVSREPPAREPEVADSATSDGVAVDSEAESILVPRAVVRRPAITRELAIKVGPWALAGAAALGAVVWFASSGTPAPAPDTRATLETPTEATSKPATEPAPAPEAPPEPAAEPQPAAPKAAAPPPAHPEPATAAHAPVAATQPAAAHQPFNRAAATSALSAAAGRASGCKKPGDPKGQARVTVTFAPNGRASQVQVAPPFAGTKTGACAAAAFRGATVPAFDGQPVPVSKGVSLR